MCEQDLRDIQIVFHKLLFLVTTSSSQADTSNCFELLYFM